MHRLGINDALVKSPPPGAFTYVSALRTGWQDELQLLIRQKHPVNFDHFPLCQFPEPVHNKLKEQNYQHLILANDRWQHFFIPPAGEFKHAAPDGMTSTEGVS